MREVYVQAGPIPLGRQGENQAQTVIWRGIAAQYAALYGEGAFQLMVARCGDAAPYPVVLTRDGDSLAWTVSDSDTAKSGVGRCELTYLVGGVVAKSKTWQTQVLASFTADGSAEPPEPAQSWVQEVLDAATAAGKSAEAAEDASVHAPQIGADGAWETWDQATGAYVSTGVEAQGPKGEDGVGKLIIELSDLAESPVTQTTSYTAQDLFAAYAKNMDLVVRANLGDDGTVLLSLALFQSSGSSVVGTWLLATNEMAIVVTGTFSGSDIEWQSSITMDDDTIEDRLSEVESTVSDLQNSVSGLQTAVDTINLSLDQKADAESVSDLSTAVGKLMPTPDDAGKFLRADAGGNPVWQTVANANGGSF